MQESFKSIKRLVDDFKAQEVAYPSPQYQEQQVREDFINKFFAALGRDITHERQKNPYEQEVHIENRVKMVNQKCFIIPVDDKYLLALLNCSVTYYLFRSILPKLPGGFYEPSSVYFKEFPIRPIDFTKPEENAKHDHIVTLVKQMLQSKEKLAASKTDAEKNRLELQCENLDRQIDEAVYELYGFTEEEIKIVEGGEKTWGVLGLCEDFSIRLVLCRMTWRDLSHPSTRRELVTPAQKAPRKLAFRGAKRREISQGPCRISPFGRYDRTAVVRISPPVEMT